VHLILTGVQAIGTPTSARRLRACLNGACERFDIDETSLACLPARAGGRISCVNDEGMLRLFFFDGLSARQRVSVTVEDARGARRGSGRGPGWTRARAASG